MQGSKKKRKTGGRNMDLMLITDQDEFACEASHKPSVTLPPSISGSTLSVRHIDYCWLPLRGSNKHSEDSDAGLQGCWFISLSINETTLLARQWLATSRRRARIQ